MFTVCSRDEKDLSCVSLCMCRLCFGHEAAPVQTSCLQEAAEDMKTFFCDPENDKEAAGKSSGSRAKEGSSSKKRKRKGSRMFKSAGMKPRRLFEDSQPTEPADTADCKQDAAEQEDPEEESQHEDDCEAESQDASAGSGFEDKDLFGDRFRLKTAPARKTKAIKDVEAPKKPPNEAGKTKALKDHPQRPPGVPDRRREEEDLLIQIDPRILDCMLPRLSEHLARVSGLECLEESIHVLLFVLPANIEGLTSAW